MTTTDELPLIRTICETPDCDVPRLVYADWLEENGKLWHAKLIHEQVARPTGWEPWDALSEDDWQQCRRELQILLGPLGMKIKQVKVRRGFVAEIRCTLADFIGEQCYQCGGCGLATLDHSDDGFHCSVCNGTGTFPGLSRTLFGTHPITQVVLTGREPWNATGLVHLVGDTQTWRWLLQNPDRKVSAHRDQIPVQICNHMIKLADREGLSYLQFSSRESAQQALSLAAVNYGRSLHGLPPLEKDQVPA
jgi:uncharacterized protein (TIGR02996 family)